MTFESYELGNLCIEITDGSHYSPEAFDGGKPMLSVKDMTEYGFNYSKCKRISNDDYDKLVKQGCKPLVDDVLIAKDGSVLKHIFRVKKQIEGVLLSSIAILRPNKELIHPDFLVYSLLNPKLRDEVLSNYVSGSGVPRVVLKDFKKIKLPIPSLIDQKKISQILRALDEKIDLNRQINKTLEQIAQAIFKSWFVDFDSVKAKIEAKEKGEDPERAAMCVISGKTDSELDLLSPDQLEQLSRTAALFPDELEESELGMIPKGWRRGKIGDEVEVVGGSTPSTKNDEYWKGGTIHWTTPKDLSGLTDKILLGTDRRITKSGLLTISSGLLPVDTVLMSSRAPVGYLALAKIPTAINQGFIAMKCSKTLPPVYVLQWANSVMDEIKQRAGGSTFAEINKNNFRQILVLVPDNQVLEKYSSIVSNIYAKINESASESESLIEIRDLLLPKLLSGEIEID